MSNEIAIAGILYDVEFVKDLHARSNGDDLLGRVDYIENKIEVLDSLKDNMVGVVVWHEILHAIAETTGLDLSESEVRGLAYQIALLLRDNPELAHVADMRPELQPRDNL